LNIIKTDNGFPYAWKAGRVEQLVRNILERKAEEQLTIDRVMLINPIWLLDRNLEDEIAEANPDFIICCSLVDPIIIQVQELIEQSGRPYVFVGNIGDYRIDFWAMVCDLNFRSYTQAELELNPNPKKFLCLNRKPHAHRRLLVDTLKTVQDQGYISLGYEHGPMMVDYQFTEEQGTRDALPDNIPIGNDIYSLGDLAVWQDSFLNIVTETTFGTARSENFFISEKTWKPILGLRPFFIYGQPELRTYLKQQGFDIFEDLIDYSSLVTEQDYAQRAVETVQRLTVDHTPEFQRRLVNNQKRFHSYVYEQWHRLFDLNLNNYL